MAQAGVELERQISKTVTQATGPPNKIFILFSILSPYNLYGFLWQLLLVADQAILVFFFFWCQIAERHINYSCKVIHKPKLHLNKSVLLRYL